MNFQPPDAHDERDDEEREADDMRQDAIVIARAAARNANDTEKQHRYLHNVDDKWMPHEWVITSIVNVMKAERGHRKLERERHDMIQDALSADLDARDTGTVRATVAAILEAIDKDMREANQPALGSPYVEVSLDAQRTIWDRVELVSQLIAIEGGGHKVKFTLMLKQK